MKMGSGCEEISGVVKGANRLHGSSKMELEVQNSGTAYLTKRVGPQTERSKERGFLFENVITNPVRYKYEFGDMVWGKIKSYPWWPGQVFNEAFAVPDVHKTKINGHVLVAFFGDGTYGWLDPLDTVPFDSHYFEKSQQTNARDFVNAVKEAELEVGSRAALGLLCRCSNSLNIRQMNIDGFFKVDVYGYAPGGLYSVKQIKSARAEFQSAELLNFVKQLGSMPHKNFQRGVHWIRNVATVLAYRRVLFEKSDEAYIESFGGKAPDLVDPKVTLSHHAIPDETEMAVSGVHPAAPVDSRMVLTWHEKESPGASFSGPVKLDTSPDISNISAGPTMVEDQQKGGTALHEEEDGMDVLKVRRQQSLLGSSRGKSSLVAETVVLEKRDAFVPKQTEFQCHRDKNDISSCGSAALSLCVAGKESITVDNRPMFRSGLVDATVDWEPNCGLDMPSSLKPPKKRFKLDNFSKIRYGSCQSDSKKKIRGESTLKSQGTDGEDGNLTVKVKSTKNSLRKIETPRTVAKPAMLVMQFPRQSKLPSVSELKAKFALFGPFENSPRVFWKSSTCRIVFKYEHSAQVAQRYAMLNRSLFGNVHVLYDVQVLQLPTPVLPKPSKQSLETTCSKVPGFTSMSTSYSSKSKAPGRQQLLPRIYQKSCLKKPQVDGEQVAMANPRGNLHVSFMLTKDESNMENLAINHILPRSSGNVLCLDGNQDDKVPLPPWLSHSYWISNALENHEIYKLVKACNERYLQDEKRCNQMQDPAQNVDVSTEILNLLERCSYILAGLKSFLGYVPNYL